VELVDILDIQELVYLVILVRQVQEHLDIQVKLDQRVLLERRDIQGIQD
jgi:hypothetical protein